MSEPTPPFPSSIEPPRRLRRFFLRHLPLTALCTAALTVLALAGLYFWASSAAGENFVRNRLVHGLQAATGGRVEIASFHWKLLHLEAEAGGVVIHGREAPEEAPCAQIGRLRLRLSLLDFWSPRILLRDLEVTAPALHLIVYPDGSTNLPQPRNPRQQGASAIERLFDAKAGRVEVARGLFHYEDRAAAFDFQNRYLPLDFIASDVALRMSYIPSASGNPESYRIEAQAANLNLSRGRPAIVASERTVKSEPLPVEGSFQAILDLTRKAAYLRSLQIVSRCRGLKDRALEISGSLEDFAHPHWQARALGDLDMKLLDPITGYPYAPAGIAHLDLIAAGQADQFRIDGPIHIDNGDYIGTGVVATGILLDARVHADPNQLLISSIVARLRQGGQLHGEVALDHWLPPLPAMPPPVARVKARKGLFRTQPRIKPPSQASVAPPHPAPIPIPVNGKVSAEFKNVSLDAIMDMVGQGPFQRLGFNTLVNGPAIATWTNGDNRTLCVAAQLALSPSQRPVAGEVPASGAIDGSYTQRDGAVDLRAFNLSLPSSRIEAHGHLGAYPLSTATAIAVELHSANLADFDTVLRDLGLTRNGRSGTAALPVALSGQAEFHGSWSGSLVDPHLAGAVTATQLAIELPTIPPNQSQFLRWDSVEATGSYSSARIAIERALLRRGKTTMALDGSLAAASLTAPSFNANSLLHLRLRASDLGIGDVQTFIGQNIPVTGSLDAQLHADGPIHALSGSGWVDLRGVSVYGEPIQRIRAQATIANQTLRFTSIAVNHAAGDLSATAAYDLHSKRFQLDAKAASLDLARIDWLRKRNLAAAGKLNISISGSGTLDDPRFETHAVIDNLSLASEPIGNLQIVARTADRIVAYDASLRLETAEFTAHGQTALGGDYATQAKLDFSHFSIGALLNFAHIQGFNGDSALAGTVTLAGPLAHPERLRGEARLQELAATLYGVHLKSEGGIHATLADSRVALDPLRITGEQTDLRAQGTLDLRGKQQLDLAASGSINLKIAETFDPDLSASGASAFQVEAHGPLRNPVLKGRIEFQDGSLALGDLPNGLSQLHGTLEFNQDRLEVKSLTAMTGGGLLSLGGYLAWQNGLYANLSATGKNIRIRYPQGISSQADAQLTLQGARNNLLLSGDVLVTRFAVSPDFDIAALTAQANAVQSIAPPDAPSNRIRLDVHVASSSQLNFQNSFAKLAGDVDLHLRGTLASPSLLGRVSIAEGSALIAGTRYELQRGELDFTNPVRIEPNIDLSATARVEDYDITLDLHGTPRKLAVNYRSDPPLPEADVVALLALGRTQNQQRLYTQQQEQSGASPTTDALLGGALNATVSSRVQKLFGAGSVKVDPNYLGALGNSTSRIIAEEQLGSNVTLTYATNVNTTAQQLIQAEVAINRHVSLLVARDESGVFSMVLKTTRRYR
jgi:translocation and assembly module TamB